MEQINLQNVVYTLECKLHQPQKQPKLQFDKLSMALVIVLQKNQKIYCKVGQRKQNGIGNQVEEKSRVIVQSILNNNQYEQGMEQEDPKNIIDIQRRHQDAFIDKMMFGT
ncbi:unnamed protein product [Paramecium octaurelia]|uniref:Uncharacterized protein n=1 Tax=Paramecium octaurelia TaxID=43137 RepID=A0A8S1VKE7_PAROT|nr:unnamed protein product [Paramecium octaurelia]